MAKNNDIILLVGAEFDKGVKSNLQKELKQMGFSAEVSAKLAKDAKKNLLSEIKDIAKNGEKTTSIDIKAKIDSASKKTINQYLKHLREQDVEINLSLSDKSINVLEAKFDSFGTKIAKKISDELAKSLNVKFDTGSLGLKEANEGTKRLENMRSSLRKLKGELQGLSSGKYATGSISGNANAQIQDIDAALATNDIDQMTVAFGKATAGAAALKKEIAGIQKQASAIGERNFAEELKRLLGMDATDESKASLRGKFESLTSGFDTKTVEEQIAAVRELDKAIAEYKATISDAASVGKKVGKDISSMNAVLSGGNKFSGNRLPAEMADEYNELARRAFEAKAALEGVKEGTGDYGKVHTDVLKIAEDYENLKGRAQEYTAAARESALALDKERLNMRIESMLASYPKIASNDDMVGRLKKIQAAIKDADSTSFKKLTKEFQNISKEASDAGLKAETFGQKVTNMFKKFTGWLSVSRIVMTLVNYIERFGQELINIDTYLTEISKTSNKTKAELASLGAEAGNAVKKYGATISGYLEGVQEMSRAGYNQTGEAEALAELSILAQSAGDVTAEVANQFLIATDASYKFSGNVVELRKVLDGANGITNQYAVNLTDIASGMSIAGASASQFGVKVDQLAAAIGTMNAVTQLGGETSARAFRYLLSVLSKTTGDIDGEIIDTDSLNKAESALAGIGVRMTEVVNGATQLRNPMETLKETAAALNDMASTDVRRANVLNALGGVNRQSSVAALLSNFDMYEKMLSTYSQSAGSTEAEALKTAESIQGRLNNIATTVTQIFANMAESDTIRGVLSIFEKILSVIERITSLGNSDFGRITAIAGGALGALLNTGFKVEETGKFIEHVSKLWSVFKKAPVDTIKKAGSSVKSFVHELWTGENRIQAYNKAYEGLVNTYGSFFRINAEGDKPRVVIADEDAYRKAAEDLTPLQLQIADVASKSGKAGIAVDELGKKFKNVGLSSKIASVGIGIFNAGLNMLVSYAIGWAIDAFITNIVQAGERAAEAAEETRSSIEKVTNAVKAAGEAVDGTKKKYEQLGEEYEKLNQKAKLVGGFENLSESDYDRYVQLSKEIIDLFPGVNTAIDSNYDRVVVLKDGVKGLNEEYEKLIENQKNEIANGGQKLWNNFRKNDSKTVDQKSALEEFYSDYQKYINGEISELSLLTSWVDTSSMQQQAKISYVSDAFAKYGYDYLSNNPFNKSALFSGFSGFESLNDNAASMIDSVYSSFMSGEYQAIESAANEIKASIIAKFEISDKESQNLGEAGIDLVRAYVNGLTAVDLDAFGTDNIEVVVSQIYDRLFGSLNDAQKKAVESAYADAVALNAKYSIGDISVGDYKAEAERIYTDLFGVYRNADLVSDILGDAYKYIDLENMISTVQNGIESGISDMDIGEMTIGDVGILFRLIYNGASYDSLEEAMAAIDAEGARIAEEAASSPRNYDNYLNGYERTSTANNRRIESINAQMDNATSATEKNTLVGKLAAVYDEEVENLNAYADEIETDLSKFSLSQDIKDAVENGTVGLLSLSDAEQETVSKYAELYDKQQSIISDVNTITAKRDALFGEYSKNIQAFYSNEVEWRQGLIDAQTAFLEETDKTDASALRKRYETLSSIYGAQKANAQGAYDELVTTFNTRMAEDPEFNGSAQATELVSLIAQFERYIREYAKLESDARTNAANAPFTAQVESAKNALDVATRNREIRNAQNELRRAQGYEVTALSGGELDFIAAQRMAQTEIVNGLKSELLNLTAGTDEYKTKQEEINQAELTLIGYLTEEANIREQIRSEADDLLTAQENLASAQGSRIENGISAASGKGLIAQSQYDALEQSYISQIALKSMELERKRAQMNADMAAGKYASGSTMWNEEMLSVMKLGEELDSLVAKYEDVAKARVDSAVNPYENMLSMLENERSRMEAERSLAEEEGYTGAALIYYTAQMQNSKDQISLLEEINRKKQDYLKNLVSENGEAVKLTDAYRQIQDEIDGNVESIISARKAMNEYRSAIEKAAYVGAGLAGYENAKNAFSPEQAVSSAVDAMETIQSGIKTGYTNSKSFVAAWEALIGSYNETFSVVSDKTRLKEIEDVSKYLTEDASGQIQFFQDLSKKSGSEDFFNFKDGIATGLKDVELSKFVEWSGFTESFVRAMAAGMSAASPDFKISSNWEDVTDDEETAADVVDDFAQKVEDLAGKSIGDLGMSDTLAYAAELSGELDKIAQRITSMPRISLDGTYTKTIGSAGGSENTQQAMARGSMRTRAGKTLVGELGPEIVVSGDEWRIVGQRGAEFTNLKSGDIVFNHVDTEEILKKKNGKPASGRAMAWGSSLLSSLRSIPSGMKSAAKSVKELFNAAVNYVSGESIGGTFATGSGTRKSGSSSGGGSSSNSKNDLIDWIEVRLKRLSDITQRWVDAASRAVGYQLQNAQLENAIAAKQEEIANNQAGYNRYMKQADSVGLDASLKERVQNGAIDINQYDDATKELISDYQTWYEKAMECKDAVDSLKDSQKELAQSKLDNIITYYENRIDRVDSATEKQKSIIDRKIALGKAVLESDYESLIKENEARASLLQSQYATLNAEFSSLIDRGMIEEGSDAWFEYRSELESIDKALIQADIDAQDYIDDMKDLALASLEYAQNTLKNTQSAIEQMMRLHEAQKESLTFKEYASLIENGMDQIDNLGKQIDHFKKLQEGLEIGSEKYREYQQEIDSLENDILNIKIAQEEWNDALIDLKIDELEKARDEYEKQNDALEKQLKLEEAIEELERARTQRTKRIYREGLGFVYEADQSAIKDAQSKLDDIRHEETMDKIDEAIDALENLKGDKNIYDYGANLIPYEGTLEASLSENAAKEILSGLMNDGVLDILKQGAANQSTNNARTVSIAIGDVIVNEAENASDLADAIVNTLPTSILQKVQTK